MSAMTLRTENQLALEPLLQISTLLLQPVSSPQTRAVSLAVSV